MKCCNKCKKQEKRIENKIVGITEDRKAGLSVMIGDCPLQDDIALNSILWDNDKDYCSKFEKK